MAHRDRKQIASVTALLLIGSAQAATAAENVSGGSLEEIIVSARHRKESMQEVPVAVSAISQNMIRDLRVKDVQDMAALIPGLDVGPTTNSSGGGLYLRGIGSTEAAAFIDQALAITIDGLQVNDARIMSATMLDLNQVEVMRGPQALFYGKNSPAGVVAISSNDPGDELEMIIGANYEYEAKEKRGHLVLSGPISETLGARLAASYSEQDGLFKVIGYDVPLNATVPLALAPTKPSYDARKDLFLRGTLLFEPTDQLRIRGKFSYFDREGGSITWGAQRTFCPLGAPQATIRVDNCKIDDTAYFGQIHPSILNGFPQADPSRPDGTLENTQKIGSIDINYSFSNGLNLAAVTGYYTSHQYTMAEGTFEPVNKVLTIYDIELDHLSQEVRLSSEWDGPLNFLTGAYYETRDSDYDHIVPGSVILGQQLTGNLVTLSLGKQFKAQEARSMSAFLQLDWAMTDTLKLSVGGRYSIEEKDFRAAGNDRVAVLAPADADWKNFSPEATLSFRPTPGIMMFASYKEGFKSGGFDSSFQPATLAQPGPHDLVFDEEIVDGFEVGIKTSLLDSSLTLNAVAFSYDYQDLQVSVSDPVSLSSRTLNAAKSQVQGVELETVWAPHAIENLTLRANLNYLDNTFDEFIGDCYTGQTVSLGCNINLNPVTGRYLSQNLAGRNLPFSQNWNGTAGFDYEIPVGGQWHLGTTLFTSYTGGYETMIQYAPGSQQKAFWEYHASLRLLSSDERWQFALIGRNLSNEFVLRRVSPVPLTGSGFGGVTATPADLAGTVVGGRTVTFEVIYKL